MAFEITVVRGLAYKLGAAALFIVIGSLLLALGFEHIGGYKPCMLCLMQRYAYYASIPALILALALGSAGRGGWAAFLFFMVAMAFFANAGLGTYHAGAEWKFWPGPTTCAGDAAALAADAGGLLKQLEATRVVRCDEAAIRVLGLSFAGWNVLTSLLVMAMTLRAAFAARQA